MLWPWLVLVFSLMTLEMLFPKLTVSCLSERQFMIQTTSKVIVHSRLNVADYMLHAKQGDSYRTTMKCIGLEEGPTFHVLQCPT